MTWADRVGDLATNAALVLINFARIFTVLVRVISEKIDGFITGLAEKSEGGVNRTETPLSGWLRFPTNTLLLLATAALRLVSIATVFIRQASSTVDEFFRVLAEGEGS